jgi:hypothetical protein
MNENLLLAFVALLAALIGGLIQAWASRAFEKSKFLRDNKRHLYGEILEAIMLQTTDFKDSDSGKAARQKILGLNSQIALFGSHAVIQSMAKVFSAKPELNDESKKQLADLLMAMRADMKWNVFQMLRHPIFAIQDRSDEKLSSAVSSLLFGMKSD